MATEETTISDLELTEDILPDMLVPVENASETKATTFSVIKNWLAGFFVGKTGDETISGIKTLDNNSRLFLLDNSALGFTLKSTKYDINSKNGNEYFGIIGFADKNNKQAARWDVYTTSSSKMRSRLLTWNKNNQAAVIQLDIDDDGITSYLNIPTPPATANAKEAINFEWLKNNSDYIVEKGVTNEINWEKWASGKLIQRGITRAAKGSTERTIVFAKPYVNTNYFVLPYARNLASTNCYSNMFIPITLSTTQFTTKANASETSLVCQWIAIGQGA